jgi:HD-like signal output (HDOD) protein
MKPLDPFAFIQEIASDLSQESIIFPTSFDTTLRLREVLNSETASANAIAAVISKDPLLATKLMRAANSAALNPSGQTITSIPTVVVRIGANAVRTMALAIAMQQLRTYKHMHPFDKLCSAVMDHTRQIAAVSFVLARERTRVAPDTALFAGLVHDIGFFYLIYRVAERRDIAPDEPELISMLRDWHDSIGHAVLSGLGTPEDVLDSVSDHDQPRPVPSMRSLKDIIHCAHAVACRMDLPKPAIPWLREAHDESLIGEFDALLQTANADRETIASIQTLI